MVGVKLHAHQTLVIGKTCVMRQGTGGVGDVAPAYAIIRA
jgi:hypothetical protein